MTSATAGLLPAPDGRAELGRKSVPLGPGDRPLIGKPTEGAEASEPTTRRVIAATALTTLAYAVVRYHLFGDVPWERLPLFTLNKAVAWSSATFLALAISIGPWQRLKRRHTRLDARQLGRWGAVGASAHVGLALVLANPTSLPKWYRSGALTDAATWATVLGAAAAATLLQSWRNPPTMSVEDKQANRRMRTLVVACVAGHTLSMGLEGWFAPSAWPGGLPPITAVAFGMLLVALGWRWRAPRG